MNRDGVKWGGWVAAVTRLWAVADLRSFALLLHLGPRFCASAGRPSSEPHTPSVWVSKASE